jgi:LysM repeat protein
MGFIRSTDSLPHGSASYHSQQAQPTPGELIDAVNALRLAYGLPPLSVNSILMYVAQTQANYLLETEGGSGHSRANGMSLTEQLLSLGYPLGGDLSLGGYRSENYVFGSGMDVQTAIQTWMGDDPHTNTMLSPNYFDIGGGVAIGSDGTVYYVIDTARHTPNGRPQDDYTPEAAGTVVTGITVNGTPGVEQFMVPVSLSTPNSGGLVIHDVKYGQTLWSIAIAYKTTIQQIRNLNDLPSNDIYSDQKLLIRRESILTPMVSPSPSPEQAAIYTPTFVPSTLTYPTHTATPAPLFRGSNPSKDNIPLIAVSIFASLCFAGMGFWASKRRN